MIIVIQTIMIAVCDEWLIFSNFEKWFDKYWKVGYQVDKDLLGDKVYSPETCVMLPKRLNVLLAGRHPKVTLQAARLFYEEGYISLTIYEIIQRKLG